MSEVFSGRYLRICLSVATILGSIPLAGILVLNSSGHFTMEVSCIPRIDRRSRTSRFLACLNRPFLSSSVADIMLSTAFVMNSFLRDFLQPFCIFSSLRWLCSLMSLSFCMDFLHPFELLLFPDCSCGRS